MKLPYFIATIGNELYSVMERSDKKPVEVLKEYIDRVAEAEIDCIDLSLLEKNKEGQKRIVLSRSDYRELADFVHKKEIEWTIAPRDIEVTDQLFDIIDFYTIETPDLEKIDLFKHIGSKGKPVRLSTEASSLSEIDQIVRVLKKAGCNEILLMHGARSCSANIKDVNLKVIATLKNLFPSVRVGYRDHIKGDNALPAMIVAYMLGAEVIEKKIKVENDELNENDEFVWNPNMFQRANQCFYSIGRMLGSSEK